MSCLAIQGEEGQRRKLDVTHAGRFQDVLAACVRLHANFQLAKPQRWRDDNKNKIRALRGGGGIGVREENCPETLFFLRNAMTMKY